MLIKPSGHVPEETVWLYRKTRTCDTVNPTPPYTFVFNMPLYFPYSTLFCLGFLSSAVHAALLQFGTHSKSVSLSYQLVPAARLVFTQSRAPPYYHGDAAVTCQLHGGDAHRPVMAQNRIVGEFCWKWKSTTPSLWEDEQLTRKTFQLYGNVAHVCSEVTGCCWWEWLTASTERDSGSDCIGKASRHSPAQSNQLQPVHSNV